MDAETDRIDWRLIARVARVRQPLALALALAPMAFALAFDQAIVPAAASLI